jgi:hypothetical protein
MRPGPQGLERWCVGRARTLRSLKRRGSERSTACEITSASAANAKSTACMPVGGQPVGCVRTYLEGGKTGGWEGACAHRAIRGGGRGPASPGNATREPATHPFPPKRAGLEREPGARAHLAVARRHTLVAPETHHRYAISKALAGIVFYGALARGQGPAGRAQAAPAWQPVGVNSVHNMKILAAGGDSLIY